MYGCRSHRADHCTFRRTAMGKQPSVLRFCCLFAVSHLSHSHLLSFIHNRLLDVVELVFGVRLVMIVPPSCCSSPSPTSSFRFRPASTSNSRKCSTSSCSVDHSMARYCTSVYQHHHNHNTAFILTCPSRLLEPTSEDPMFFPTAGFLVFELVCCHFRLCLLTTNFIRFTTSHSSN